ncbi:MAG: Acetyl-CoA synthetase [uncultured Solirubrobacteraceae bacterium]|uniref:Acetyl-CoA synthetase n=1 Tax=uncultured Solirubrobacteraceae bacterium TaxID=1162706 RepID=A0A6J4T4E4_9ACTN|nr:MAG: Acetyl-CoA synthetase [uncultured Solirubrobacteraceae bacterium]
MNFARDVVDAADPSALALVERARDGRRREWRFAEVAEGAARLAGWMRARGVGRGDVVMTLVGNRPEWVMAMVACFRLGAVVLPCPEQLRPTDLARSVGVVSPTLVLADPRNRATLEAAALGCPVAYVDESGLFDGPDVAEAVTLRPLDPCLLTFTSGTAGEPKAVLHGQRYLAGQAVQAEHWLAPARGDLVWCTAASGWSKSARNVFIAPWLRGAAALLHDARFDPAARLELVERERVAVLCMAPTEYRVIAARVPLRAAPALRGLVSAGEALNPEVLRIWQQATGLPIRDGYGQTETGQLTGMPAGGEIRPGSMGRALPGTRLWIEDGELVADPATVPTFFLGYLGADGGGEAPGGPWRTGDRVREDADGFLFFEGRTDDVIISAGYRIGPFEVESALVEHPAVAEAAVVAAPDAERGSVVRAVVVLRSGFTGTPELARELQEHTKAATAPYKYPRVVEWADELPKTASGKVRRAVLRDSG